MSSESSGESSNHMLSLGEERTREFLKDHFGCTVQTDMATLSEKEPVICVIWDELRSSGRFKRGENQYGPPSFVVFFGVRNPTPVIQDADWAPLFGNEIEFTNFGKAVFCSLSPAGEVSIWRTEGENREYKMPSNVIFKPPATTPDSEALSRWQQFLERLTREKTS